VSRTSTRSRSKASQRLWGMLGIVVTLALPSVAAASSTPPLHRTGGPADYLERQLYDVRTINPSNAWAVGSIMDASTGLGQPLVVHWTGAGWKRVDVPLPDGADGGELDALGGAGPDDIWAVGMYYEHSGGLTFFYCLVAHWDGTAWHVVAAPTTRGEIDDVRVFAANDVWAAGTHFPDGEPLIMHWNGSDWSISSGAPTHGLLAIAGAAPDDLWAAGADGFVEHYDGSTWTQVPAPNPGVDQGYRNDFIALGVVGSNDIWMVGNHFRDSPSSYRGLVEHWDGNQWSLVHIPDASHVRDWQEIGGVSALSAGDAWISGDYLTDQSYEHAMFLHWNGARWRPTAVPRSVHVLQMNGISAKRPNDVWAVGDSTDYFALHYHWEGTRWTRS
jgi:hypothetical protein